MGIFGWGKNEDKPTPAHDPTKPRVFTQEEIDAEIRRQTGMNPENSAYGHNVALRRHDGGVLYSNELDIAPHEIGSKTPLGLQIAVSEQLEKFANEKENGKFRPPELDIQITDTRQVEELKKIIIDKFGLSRDTFKPPGNESQIEALKTDNNDWSAFPPGKKSRYQITDDDYES